MWDRRVSRGAYDLSLTFKPAGGRSLLSLPNGKPAPGMLGLFAGLKGCLQLLFYLLGGSFPSCAERQSSTSAVRDDASLFSYNAISAISQSQCIHRVVLAASKSSEVLCRATRPDHTLRSSGRYYTLLYSSDSVFNRCWITHTLYRLVGL